jgi:uncharacterized protein YyaL (SSP411 family)
LYAGVPGGKGAASVWEAGVELSALNAAARVDRKWAGEAEKYAEALSAYRGKVRGLWAYRPFVTGAPKGIYFDDNEWLVLGFLETFEVSGEKKYLQLAEETFAFVESGESGELGGGIYWRDKRDSKNTCSNGPAICGAVRLYQVTGEKKYLEMALRLYKWVNEHFQDGDGLYWDTLHLDGSVEKTKWSYNSALMIRGNVLLYEVTKEKKYLVEAQRIAGAAEKKWFKADGEVSDPGKFAHLLCEAELYLGEAEGDSGRLKKVERVLGKLGEEQKDGVYPERWDGWRKKDLEQKLIDQASVARAYWVVAWVEGKSR